MKQEPRDNAPIKHDLLPHTRTAQSHFTRENFHQITEEEEKEEDNNDDEDHHHQQQQQQHSESDKTDHKEAHRLARYDPFFFVLCIALH